MRRLRESRGTSPPTAAATAGAIITATDLIDSGYRRAQQNTDQVRADLQAGRERGVSDARRAQQQHGSGEPVGTGAHPTHGGNRYADPSQPTVAIDPRNDRR